MRPERRALSRKCFNSLFEMQELGDPRKVVEKLRVSILCLRCARREGGGVCAVGGLWFQFSV